MKETANSIDLWVFKLFGVTLISNPEKVSMKQVHLDSGILYGRSVIVEGDIVEVGNYSTHLVISDSTARMLIILTEILPKLGTEEELKGKSIKVLGSVENGNKGLPYIQAKVVAINKNKKNG